MVGAALPVFKTYVMYSAEDMTNTINNQATTKFYGEVTKHGSQFGFFHGWDCVTHDVQVNCHRFLPSEDWENIMDVRYTKDYNVTLSIYEEANNFATLYSDTIILKDAW